MTRQAEMQMPMAAIPVTISAEDKASQLSLTKDGLTLTGDKGYRMARAVIGVDSGCWYFESKIAEKRSDDAHYRLGWATREAELQAPVGFDKHGFGYRDRLGSIVHSSNRIDSFCAPYGAGDVIGCMIVFNKTDEECGNYIRFFHNGIDQGIAFRRVPDATYYPAFSLYANAQITANFGPTWLFPPIIVKEPDRQLEPPRPISDLSSKIKPPLKRDPASTTSEFATRSSKRYRS